MDTGEIVFSDADGIIVVGLGRVELEFCLMVFILLKFAHKLLREHTESND